MKKLLLGMAALAALFTGACCRESGNSPTVTGATPRSAQVKLSEGGKTAYTIVYDFGADDVLVDPAVRDLAAVLAEITGAEFVVKPAAEGEGPKIVIGKAAPGDKEEFRSRERRIKSVGADLYLYGGDRYGTAGAIYNFLREFCGCRWYTATGCKRIPKNPDLAFAAIDYRHVPSFKSLEHGGKWVNAARTPEIRDWVRRNNSFLMPDYAFGAPDDAWFYIGPVTHTLSAYMPPIIRKPRSFNADGSFFAGPHPTLAGKEYFSTHPEYFSLMKGKRVPDSQLCFSNPEVRRELLKNIENAIAAEKYDPSKDAILDISQNDRSRGFCECDACRKFNEKYGTPGGVYFDFLVEMGNHFIKKYPKLTFRFFAYQEDMTGIPPKGLRFPDNMSVILAPLQQDFSKPFTHRYNVRFLNQMREWGKLCKEIWIWNYPTLYPHGMLIYSLFPGVYRNTENLKLAHEAGVRYIIAEQGGSVVHGCAFKELNVYLQDLMAEDVNVDVDAAIREFCGAVYGAAAEDVIAYLKETDKLCKEDPGYFRYYYDPRVMRRVLHTPANLIRWQRLFDRMEAKVAGDPSALFNVRRARINLDAVTSLSYDACAKADPAFAKELPFDALYKRYCDYVKADAEVEFRSCAEAKTYVRNQTGSFVLPIRMVRAFRSHPQRYPEELIAKYGRENLVTPMMCQERRDPAVWDKNTASGYAVRIPVPTPSVDLIDQLIDVGVKDGLPWNNVIYKPLRKSFLTAADLKKIRASKGYRLIYVGRGKLSVSGVLKLATLPNRHASFFLGEFFDPQDPDREYDFYLSIRNAGKSLLVDRLVLAKVPKR